MISVFIHYVDFWQNLLFFFRVIWRTAMHPGHSGFIQILSSLWIESLFFLFHLMYNIHLHRHNFWVLSMSLKFILRLSLLLNCHRCIPDRKKVYFCTLVICRMHRKVKLDFEHPRWMFSSCLTFFVLECMLELAVNM